jgi:uncharacterized protein
MAHYYLDSSALVKRYVAERGTSWISHVCDAASGHTLYTVRISGAELIAALFRRSRAGSLSVLDAQAEAAQFKADVPYDYEIVEVTEALVNAAMILAERHGLRGYDAVQLAAALELQTTLTASGLPTLTLVSADAELNAAAVAEGLMVEDPNLYP